MRVKSFNDIAKGAIKEFIDKYDGEFTENKKRVESFRKICDKLDVLVYNIDCEELNIAITSAFTGVCIRCDMFVPDLYKETFYDILSHANNCVFTYDGPDQMSVILEYPSVVDWKG